MEPEIRPTRPEDLPALSRFLTSGFGASPDAEFAAPDVLAWKSFDPDGSDADGDRPRSLLALEGETIVGHLGLMHMTLRDTRDPGWRLPTLHMIDWLASPGGRSVGARLMRRANGLARVQVGIGGTTIARRVSEGGGYKLVGQIPLYRRVFRPMHRWRAAGAGWRERLRWVARDVADRATAGGIGRLARGYEWRDVERFDADAVEAIVGGCGRAMLWTERTAERLNHLLRHPRGRLRGGWIVAEGAADPIGYAVISVVDRSGLRIGQLADLVVSGNDAAGLGAGLALATRRLRELGADAATGFAGAEWLAAAYDAAEYRTRTGIEMYIRDRGAMLPGGAPFVGMPIDADYAYL